MYVNLLTAHHLEFLSLKEAAQARMSLHLSKCHIVGNHMSWLKYIVYDDDPFITQSMTPMTPATKARMKAIIVRAKPPE